MTLPTRTRLFASLLALLLALSTPAASLAEADNWSDQATEEVHWVALCGRLNNSSSDFTVRLSVVENVLDDRLSALKDEGYQTALPGEIVHYRGQQAIVQYNCEVAEVYDPTVSVALLITFAVIMCFYRSLPYDWSGTERRAPRYY